MRKEIRSLLIGLLKLLAVLLLFYGAIMLSDFPNARKGDPITAGFSVRDLP